MYQYEDIKEELNTENGKDCLVSTSIAAATLQSFSIGDIMDEICKLQGTTDSWLLLACIDRLKETHRIRETTVGNNVFTQARTFVFIR